MVYAPAKTRIPWEDRFNRPSLHDLREHYNSQMSRLLDQARERLLSFEGAQEEIAWEGVAWRWTFVYRLANDPTRAWAYLVPHPENPRLAIPMTTPMVEALPRRRLKKYITEGVATAKRVGDIHWASWEVANKTNLDEVLDLAKRKYKFINESAGGGRH
ncbi:MAG: hypothetical protein EA376_12070 [Phycisphaeraceae bacterium]|nr:MAG: hypothetical protein EA376_12070 [Phycisphaeraceae bacterium]